METYQMEDENIQEGDSRKADLYCILCTGAIQFILHQINQHLISSFTSKGGTYSCKNISYLLYFPIPTVERIYLYCAALYGSLLSFYGAGLRLSPVG